MSLEHIAWAAKWPDFLDQILIIFIVFPKWRLTIAILSNYSSSSIFISSFRP